MGETGKFDQKDGFTAFSNIRFPEGKEFGSLFVKQISVQIVSMFSVEGSAQGDPPPQQHQHHQSPQPLQHSSDLKLNLNFTGDTPVPLYICTTF